MTINPLKQERIINKPVSVHKLKADSYNSTKRLNNQITKDVFDCSKDKGKISFKSKLINLNKGFITPKLITFKSRKDFTAEDKTNPDEFETVKYEQMFSDIQNEPDICPEGKIKSHHSVSGENLNIRRAVKLKEKAKTTTLTEREQKETAINEKIAKDIDEEFSRLKPLEKDCVVYRGRSEHFLGGIFNSDFEIIENAKTGDIVIPDTAYSYTSAYSSIADNWGKRGRSLLTKEDGSKCRVLSYKIKIPKGAKVSRNLEHGSEVLMPRNARYKLLSKETNELGDMFVVMEYILPEE